MIYINKKFQNTHTPQRKPLGAPQERVQQSQKANAGPSSHFIQQAVLRPRTVPYQEYTQI